MIPGRTGGCCTHPSAASTASSSLPQSPPHQTEQILSQGSSQDLEEPPENQTYITKDCHPTAPTLVYAFPSSREAQKLLCLCGQQRAQECKHEHQVCPRLTFAGFQTTLVLVGSFLCFSQLSPQALQETQSSWQGHGRAVGLVVPCQCWPRAANTKQQLLVVRSLTLMDVQVALGQAGIFTLPREQCSGRRELQRWVALHVLVASWFWTKPAAVLTPQAALNHPGHLQTQQ